MQKKDLEMYTEGCQMMLAPSVINSASPYTHTHTHPASAAVNISTTRYLQKVEPFFTRLISLMVEMVLGGD